MCCRCTLTCPIGYARGSPAGPPESRCGPASGAQGKEAGTLLKIDLEAAGIAYKDEMGPTPIFTP